MSVQAARLFLCRRLDSQNNFEKKVNSMLLKNIPALIEKTFPMPARFRSSLPSQIAELSRLLTGARGERALSYLNRPNYLSAYLRYFLPWNLHRLCLILPSLNIPLNSGSVIIDLGSGPLTFVCALWLSKPHLRRLPLEFVCVDRSSAALEAGKKLFTAVSGGGCNETCQWKINLVREDIDTRQMKIPPKTKNVIAEKKAALVCAINLFNEIYENLPHHNTEALRRTAENTASFMNELACADGCILTVEPGIPQAGKFISFLRSAFLELDRPPAAPCTHTAACPLSGREKRWCHFAFETDQSGVPNELLRLSAAAGLPKERLVLSFLLAAGAEANGKKAADKIQARVISDAFPLPNNCFGRYCCSERGLVLLTGEKALIEKINSFSIVEPVFAADKRDAKSGALIVSLPKADPSKAESQSNKHTFKRKQHG